MSEFTQNENLERKGDFLPFFERKNRANRRG